MPFESRRLTSGTNGEPHQVREVFGNIARMLKNETGCRNRRIEPLKLSKNPPPKRKMEGGYLLCFFFFVIFLSGLNLEIMVILPKKTSIIDTFGLLNYNKVKKNLRKF